jgi:hypothetical protein
VQSSQDTATPIPLGTCRDSNNESVAAINGRRNDARQ